MAKSKSPKPQKKEVGFKSANHLQRQTLLFFFINVIFEGAAAGIGIFCLFTQKMYDVLQGLFLAIFLYFIFVPLIPDFMYIFLMIGLRALGIDPLAVMFNFIVSFICVSIGILLLVGCLLHDITVTDYMLIAASALSILSGAVHLFNGIRCHKRTPITEKYYPPKDPNRRQLKIERKRQHKDQKLAKKKEKKDKSANKTKTPKENTSKDTKAVAKEDTKIQAKQKGK